MTTMSAVTGLNISFKGFGLITTVRRCCTGGVRYCRRAYLIQGIV